MAKTDNIPLTKDEVRAEMDKYIKWGKEAVRKSKSFWYAITFRAWGQEEWARHCYDRAEWYAQRLTNWEEERG